MQLHDLKRSKGLKDKSTRKWRWNASKWNTSWRWNKWQGARAWYSRKPFFEWWQTPLVQRVPKMKWFKRHLKLVDIYTIINLRQLESDDRLIDKLNKDVLLELWYIKKKTELVKLLWNGDLSKKLNCSGIEKYSKSAIEKINKVWWNVKVLE